MVQLLVDIVMSSFKFGIINIDRQLHRLTSVFGPVTALSGMGNASHKARKKDTMVPNEKRWSQDLITIQHDRPGILVRQIDLASIECRVHNTILK